MAASLLLLLLVLSSSMALARAGDSQDLPGGLPGDLLARLHAGGHNIYFRHAATDWTQQDRIDAPAEWSSCDPAVARQLSGAGRDAAAAVGAAMRALAIPVSELVASPYCRTMETARLLGYGDPLPTEAVLNLRVAGFVGGRAAVVASARHLLGSPPPPGGNRVIVAHGNVAREATPVYPAEAEAVVFRPDGRGGFEVIARVAPEAWRTLGARDGLEMQVP
jgi:hypothetical protein